jgi:hypothetical protein
MQDTVSNVSLGGVAVSNGQFLGVVAVNNGQHSTVVMTILTTLIGIWQAADVDCSIFWNRQIYPWCLYGAKTEQLIQIWLEAFAWALFTVVAGHLIIKYCCRRRALAPVQALAALPVAFILPTQAAGQPLDRDNTDMTDHTFIYVWLSVLTIILFYYIYLSIKSSCEESRFRRLDISDDSESEDDEKEQVLLEHVSTPRSVIVDTSVFSFDSDDEGIQRRTLPFPPRVRRGRRPHLCCEHPVDAPLLQLSETKEERGSSSPIEIKAVAHADDPFEVKRFSLPVSGDTDSDEEAREPARFFATGDTDSDDESDQLYGPHFAVSGQTDVECNSSTFTTTTVVPAGTVMYSTPTVFSSGFKHDAKHIFEKTLTGLLVICCLPSVLAADEQPQPSLVTPLVYVYYWLIATIVISLSVLLTRKLWQLVVTPAANQLGQNFAQGAVNVAAPAIPAAAQNAGRGLVRGIGNGVVDLAGDAAHAVGDAVFNRKSAAVAAGIAACVAAYSTLKPTTEDLVEAQSHQDPVVKRKAVHKYIKSTKKYIAFKLALTQLTAATLSLDSDISRYLHSTSSNQKVIDGLFKTVEATTDAFSEPISRKQPPRKQLFKRKSVDEAQAIEFKEDEVDQDLLEELNSLGLEAEAPEEEVEPMMNSESKAVPLPPESKEESPFENIDKIQVYDHEGVIGLSDYPTVTINTFSQLEKSLTVTDRVIGKGPGWGLFDVSCEAKFMMSVDCSGCLTFPYPFTVKTGSGPVNYSRDFCSKCLSFGKCQGGTRMVLSKMFTKEDKFKTFGYIPAISWVACMRAASDDSLSLNDLSPTEASGVFACVKSVLEALGLAQLTPLEINLATVTDLIKRPEVKEAARKWIRGRQRALAFRNLFLSSPSNQGYQFLSQDLRSTKYNLSYDVVMKYRLLRAKYSTMSMASSVKTKTISGVSIAAEGSVKLIKRNPKTAAAGFVVGAAILTAAVVPSIRRKVKGAWDYVTSPFYSKRVEHPIAESGLRPEKKQTICSWKTADTWCLNPRVSTPSVVLKPVQIGSHQTKEVFEERFCSEHTLLFQELYKKQIEKNKAAHAFNRLVESRSEFESENSEVKVEEIPDYNRGQAKQDVSGKLKRYATPCWSLVEPRHRPEVWGFIPSLAKVYGLTGTASKILLPKKDGSGDVEQDQYVVNLRTSDFKCPGHKQCYYLHPGDWAQRGRGNKVATVYYDKLKVCKFCNGPEHPLMGMVRGHSVSSHGGKGHQQKRGYKREPGLFANQTEIPKDKIFSRMEGNDFAGWYGASVAPNLVKSVKIEESDGKAVHEISTIMPLTWKVFQTGEHPQKVLAKVLSLIPAFAEGTKLLVERKDGGVSELELRVKDEREPSLTSNIGDVLRSLRAKDQEAANSLRAGQKAEVLVESKEVRKGVSKPAPVQILSKFGEAKHQYQASVLPPRILKVKIPRIIEQIQKTKKDLLIPGTSGTAKSKLLAEVIKLEKELTTMKEQLKAAGVAANSLLSIDDVDFTDLIETIETYEESEDYFLDSMISEVEDHAILASSPVRSVALAKSVFGVRAYYLKKGEHKARSVNGDGFLINGCVITAKHTFLKPDLLKDGWVCKSVHLIPQGSGEQDLYPVSNYFIYDELKAEAKAEWMPSNCPFLFHRIKDIAVAPPVAAFALPVPVPFIPAQGTPEGKIPRTRGYPISLFSVSISGIPGPATAPKDSHGHWNQHVSSPFGSKDGFAWEGVEEGEYSCAGGASGGLIVSGNYCDGMHVSGSVQGTGMSGYYYGVETLLKVTESLKKAPVGNVLVPGAQQVQQVPNLSLITSSEPSVPSQNLNLSGFDFDPLNSVQQQSTSQIGGQGLAELKQSHPSNLKPGLATQTQISNPSAKPIPPQLKPNLPSSKTVSFQMTSNSTPKSQSNQTQSNSSETTDINGQDLTLFDSLSLSSSSLV